MKIRSFLYAVLITLVAACSHSHQHSHHHHEKHEGSSSDQGLTLNQGKKWQPDEVMRKNMDDIHTGLVVLIKKEKAKNASEKDYLKFYDVVQSHTEMIISNCKMAPEMDQVYHVILEEMLETAEDLKDPAKRVTVSSRFVSTLMKYMEYFDQKFAH